MNDEYDTLLRDVRKLEERIDRYLDKLAERQVFSQQRIQKLEIEIIDHHASIDEGARKASILQSALAALKLTLGKLS